VKTWLDPTLLPTASSFTFVVAVICAAGFMRGFVGFGAALITVPTLSVMIGPLVAVPVSIIIALPATIQLLPEALRHGEGPVVLPVALGVLLATPLGALLLVSINPDLMKIIISVLVIGMTAMLWRGWSLGHKVGRPTLIGAGIAGGIVQGSAGIGGPPVVAVALSRPGAARQQRANVLGVMTAVSLSSILPFWYHGLLAPPVFVLGLSLIPFSLVATWLGSRYFSRRGQGHYRKAALVVLAMVGLGTLTMAIRDYLQAS
jgi:uncharacterized membrane protein YfcA